MLIIVFALAVVLLVAGDVLACPNCKDALPAATGPAGESGGPATAEGFYYSILVMMSAPFVLAASFGGTIWYYTRKAASHPA